MNATQRPSVTFDSLVRRSTDQVSSDVEGEVAIMSIERGNYYMLNEIGARFWELIQPPSRLTDVCATLLDEYDVPRAQCESEILKLAEQLLEQDLIEVVDAAST